MGCIVVAFSGRQIFEPHNPRLALHYGTEKCAYEHDGHRRMFRYLTVGLLHIT